MQTHLVRTLAALILGVTVTSAARAQSFTPPAAATSSSTTLFTDLDQAQSLAVDASGNLFFSRPGLGVLAEKPANGGAEITLYTLANGSGGYPKGVAANNSYAFMSDYGGHLWRVPVGGGSATDLLPACNSLDGYYLGTQELAADGLGNVYAAGNNESGLFKIDAADNCSVVSGVTLDGNSHISADAAGDIAFSTGGVLYSLPVGAAAPVAVPGTFNSIIGLRADAFGNVFVTTYSGIVEVPFIHGALDGTRAFTVIAGSSQNDVAVGADGAIYTTSGTNIVRSRIGSVRFAASAVGTASATQSVNVLFNSAVVLTGFRYGAGTGVSSEIVNAGSGNCAAGAYAAGASCTIDLTFTPSGLGVRSGAVSLLSAAGVVGSVAVAGQGTGAGLVADPGTQANLGAGWQAPSGIAVDASGAVFVADRTAGTVTYFAPGGATSAVIASGLTSPSGVAVAGDGTVYVANTGANTVVQIPFNGLTYGVPAPVLTGLSAPSALAISAGGSLYVANTGAGSVLRIPNQSGILNFFDAGAVAGTYTAPDGLAFDKSGNLFVADSTTGSLFQVTGPSVSTVATNLTLPGAIAVDDSGSLYVVQKGIATVLRIALLNGSYATNSTTTLGTGFTAPASIAMDSAGNLYVADSSAPSATFIQRTAGLLDMGRSNLTVSSVSQSLSFSNAGDAVLTFGAPLYTASGNTGDFTINSTGNACPAAGSLAAAASCSIAATFTPTTTGTRSETLTITSNAVNATPVTGTFTGTGVSLPATAVALSTTPSGSVTYGTPITATALVSVAGGGAGTPTGSVTFLVNGVVYRVVPLSGGSASATVTGLPAGSNTIDAAYSGDANFAASVGATATITVTLAPTTTTFTSSISSATSVPPGTNVTFGATVTSAVTTTKPTGNVDFVANGTVLATAAVNPTTGAASVSLTTLPTGTYAINAVYRGDSGFATSSSAAITVAVLAPNFVVAGKPSALTVTAPGSVTTSFSVTPISGYVGGVDMSCSGLPANTQCIFLPAVIQFTGSSRAAQTVNLTIQTNTPPPTTVAWMLPLGALFLLGGITQRRRLGGVRLLSLMLLAGASMMAIAGLSGCSSTAVSTTPGGTSTVTVTLLGSANGTTSVPVNSNGNLPPQTFTFALTVK